MAAYRDDNRGPGNGIPRRPYADEHRDRRAPPRYAREPSPPLPYSPPPYDRRRSPSPDGPRHASSHGHEFRRQDDYNGRHRSYRGDGGYRYRDRDREGYRSPDYDGRGSSSRSRSRSRSRSPSRSRPRRRRSRTPPREDVGPGRPSRDVMMDGLPLDVFEEDILHQLKQYHGEADAESVRVIRDHQTKASRGFGFLRFSSLDKARSFMDRNYPSLSMDSKRDGGSDLTTVKVRLVFSREREERLPQEKAEEWTCTVCSFTNYAGRRICLKCQSSHLDQTENTTERAMLKSGDSDAALDNVPSQYLLIRGLEPGVTEEVLAKGIAKLYRPDPAQTAIVSTSVKKAGSKVASTTGDANLGAQANSLRRILLVRGRQSHESWRYGFAEFCSVDEASAALARFNSFEKFTISSKAVLVSYIHAGVFVPVFNPFDGYETISFVSTANPSLRLQYWDESAFVSELSMAQEPDQATVDRDSANGAHSSRSIPAVGEEGIVSITERDAKARKRKNEAKEVPSGTKKVAPHLQFWSNRHAELHGGRQAARDGSDKQEESASSAKQQKASTIQSKVHVQSFADPKKHCCYLCSRQFKTAAEANKHERLSQLHSDNLKNEDLVGKAHQKLKKAGIATTVSDGDGPEYRDRAKERRAAFGGSSRIALPMKKTATATTTEDAAEEEKAPSKGAALLGKMGWSSGQGLGAQGTGSANPVATEIYAEGVGLGAQGARLGDAATEAERKTKNSYGEFVERARDKAKERFERMA